MTGVGLSWYGRIPPEYPHNSSSATYSIDGGNPISFQLAGLPAGSNSLLLNQIFFTTPTLTAGPHSLLVVNGGNNQTTPLNLDYLIVTNSATSTDSPGTTSSSANPVSTSNGTSVGAIVGGVIGGVIVVVAIIVALLLLRRRQRPTTGLGDIPVDPFRSPPLEPQLSLQRELQREPPSAVHLIYEDSGNRFSDEDHTAQSPPEYTKSNPLRSS
jgi:hypothetical protein